MFQLLFETEYTPDLLFYYLTNRFDIIGKVRKQKVCESLHSCFIQIQAFYDFFLFVRHAHFRTKKKKTFLEEFFATQLALPSCRICSLVTTISHFIF